MTRSKALRSIVAVVVVAAVMLGGLYAFIVWEGSSAREDAPPIEATIGQWLLHRTVPASFRAMKNPLSAVAEGTGKCLNELKFLRQVASADRQWR